MRKPARWVAAAAALAIASLAVALHLRDAPPRLPSRLSDRAFWQLVTDLSENGGSFLTSNYVSNERAYQRVIPALERRAARGGVYIGVGPDQNFTYISALDPAVAFIVDIRRENMLLHLMHKAMIELSPDRFAYLSRLFSRRPPARLDATASARALLDAYAFAPADLSLLDANIRAVADHLMRAHAFALAPDDLAAIARTQRAFFDAGPEMRYAYPHRVFPTYAELMVETDDRGESHSYLTSEDAFQRLKRLERNNLIVPVVGDFAGRKALRAIAAYLARHGATVSVFYASNVEFYLSESGGWKKFVDNVASLPFDARSLFIRTSFEAGSTTQLLPIAAAITGH